MIRAKKIWMDDHEKWSDKMADEAEMHRIDDAILTSRNRMKEKDWHDPAKTPNVIKQIVDAILEKEATGRWKEVCVSLQTAADILRLLVQ